MSEHRYEMGIDLNVLNHLGLNLYSNTPAVLSEVIANSWDADATEVKVEFDIGQGEIAIHDNGVGMNLEDINKRYLLVGYQKRKYQTETRRGRKPMGRKGIGKLSLFSIANKISLYTQKEGNQQESLLMDATKIRELIEGGNTSQLRKYRPVAIDSDATLEGSGTIIRIRDLKKVSLTNATIFNLRKRIARRFGIMGGRHDFHIFVDGQEIKISDRDYFHKARFIFRFGPHPYETYCTNLDLDDNGNGLSFLRKHRFGSDGIASDDGHYEIGGWIGIARKSNQLDGQGDDENLNRITVLVREKIAQEDILQEFRLGGMITKYIYGEIYADFLDLDESDDIATSGRQRILENDERYQALKAYLRRELNHIWIKTNTLKEKSGLENALSRNPHLREWFDGIGSNAVQRVAQRFFGAIDQAGVDDELRNEFYANAVLAIETLRMREILHELPNIDESNITPFLRVLADVDAVEKAKYHEIVEGRIEVIRSLKQIVDSDALEKVIQRYIFDHLWLLDPGWERATSNPSMEKTIQSVLDGIADQGRIDIRYQQVMAEHVIVELKRPSVRKHKTELEHQARRYIRGVQQELADAGGGSEAIQCICLVGKLPPEWSNRDEKIRDEIGLRMHSIRIITYKELVNNAESAYRKFTSESQEVGQLRRRIDAIRSYQEAPPVS